MDTCFPEETKIINVSTPADASGTGLVTEWICMKDAKRATWFVQTGALSASADSMVVTLNVAASKSGATAATLYSKMDLPFDHYWLANATTGSTSASSLASNADMYTKTATSTNSTFTITSSQDNLLFVIEVEAAKLGQFSSSSVTYDADYVRLAIAAPGDVALLSGICILTGIRYKEDTPPTVLL